MLFGVGFARLLLLSQFLEPNDRVLSGIVWIAPVPCPYHRDAQDGLRFGRSPCQGPTELAVALLHQLHVSAARSSSMSVGADDATDIARVAGGFLPGFVSHSWVSLASMLALDIFQGFPGDFRANASENLRTTVRLQLWREPVCALLVLADRHRRGTAWNVCTGFPSTAPGS